MSAACVFLLLLTGSILNARCGGSVYRYPLADYTGTAEVIHGGSSGYSGLGEVTSFQPHPSLPYNSLYFHGTAASYLELMLGGDYTLKNDWSFTMFVYSIAPHRGTIFDLAYEGRTQQKTGFFFTRIKLELNESNIVLTMHGPSGQDYGSATVGTIFTAEEWIPLTVVHDKATGDVIMFTEAQEFYNSKQIQDNQNNIVIQQPAKIKLGGAYQDHTPFKGSIVCFLVYDMKVSKNHFPSALDECQPENWIIKDNIIDLSSLTARPTTSTPAQSSSTITEITSSATVTQNQQFSSSTTLQTSPRSPVTLGSTESHQSLGSISSTTTGSQQSTRSTFASTSESQRPLSSASLRTTAAHQSPSSTSFPSPPISDFQTTTESPHSPRESYGYFNVIAKDRRPPSNVAAIATLELSSNRQCGHACLTLQTCRSFTYNKPSCLCSLYSLSDYSSTEILTGTHLYKRLIKK